MNTSRKLVVMILIVAIFIGAFMVFLLREMGTTSVSETPRIVRTPLTQPVETSVKVFDGIPRIVTNDDAVLPFTGFQFYPSFSPYSGGSVTLWKQRIDYLSESGFTYVCPWLFWPLMDTHKTGIPEDAGEWINWEPLDAFFEYAAAKGVYVIPYFWFAYAPDWWYREFGNDYTQLNDMGLKTDPSRPIVCFNASEAHWRYVDQVIRALVDRYKDHPALLGWALSVGSTSENNYAGGNLYGVPGWFDYSDFSKNQFREWLRKTYYNDINAFQKSWGNDSTSFENAEIPKPLPPAEPSIVSVNGGGDPRRAFYDWQLFRLEQKKVTREHFGRLYKKYDPDHIVLTMAGVFPFWGGMTEYQGTVWPAVCAIDYFDVINASYIDGVILQPPINEYAWHNIRWGFLYSYVKYTHSRGKVFSACLEDFGVNDKVWVIDSFIHFASVLGCGIGWVEGSEGESQTPWSDVEREAIKKCWYLSYGLPGTIARKAKIALIDSPVLLSMDYQEKGSQWTGFKAIDLVATTEMLADAGLEYDVFTEYDIVADPSLLDSYSVVALVSLFRMTDELLDVLVKYRENGGGLFIAGRTAVYNEYGNYDLTGLQRLLGVSQLFDEYVIDSAKAWQFTSDDESGLVRGVEGTGIFNTVYNIPFFDYENEGYRVIGHLSVNPHVGVVGYKAKTVFWFSPLGKPWGLFQPDPKEFEATLQFMRNLYDYYSVNHDTLDGFWLEDVGGRYRFLLTNEGRGYNGSIGFDVDDSEHDDSASYLVYDWTGMKALTLGSANEKGIVKTTLKIEQNQPVLIGITRCASMPCFVAAEWCVYRSESWDNQTQTLRILLDTINYKEAQITVYLAGKEPESINVVGGEVLEIEKNESNKVLKVLFKPERDNATLEMQFPSAAYSWLIDGAIYEVNIEYLPNNKFSELAEMMPRLEQMGVKTIYMLPIWECSGGALYLITDHYKINSRYGNDADLKALVKSAHKHGIRVILDFVTSLSTEGSYIFENHPEWILRGDDGEMQRYFPFPEWGWALDCANPEVIEYFTNVARYYVEEYDVDGWRIDSPQNNYDPRKVSSDHSRLSLLRSAKAAVAEIKPNAIFCAEIAGPSMFWSEVATEAEPLFDEVCEISYNYPFCGFMGGSDVDGYNYMITEAWTDPEWQTKYIETTLNKIVHNRATSEEFVNAIMNQGVMYSQLRANFIENHDTVRVSKAFPLRHRPLFVLVACMPGVPVVHAGQEIGESKLLESEQVKVDWNKADKELEAFYFKVLNVRARNIALRYGDVRNVWADGDNTIAFLRSFQNNNVIIVLNFNSNAARCVLSVQAEELGLNPEGEYMLHDQLNDETFRCKCSELKSYKLDLEPYGYKLMVIESLNE